MPQKAEVFFAPTNARYGMHELVLKTLVKICYNIELGFSAKEV